MNRLVASLLAIPCLAQGIRAQSPSATAPGDTALHPITLQEAVKLAQRNAPAAVQARGQITTAESSVRSAYGAFLPSLNASMGQSKQGGQRFGQNGTLVTYQAQPWSYSTGLNANLQLFDGGKRFSDLRARRADVSSAEANETAQQFNLALQVKTQYANILAARESEAAARAQYEQAEQQLKAASARVAAGAATLSDSLRSVIQVGNARLALITAQNNLRVASASLTRLVGTPYLVTADPADTVDHPLAPVDSAELAALALHGPAVEQAQAQANSASAAVASARTSYLPTINMSYSYNGNGFDKYYGLGPGQLAYGTSLGFSLRFPIFDNFSREDNITRARVSEDVAKAQLRDARLAAQQNIIQQLGALNTAQEQIRIQEASVAAAEEDLRVQQQRYALGASTLLDLLTSQSTLDQARAGLIQARQNYRIARAQIEAIIGRDLQ
ncbi:MAG TPA: TolC family protein [Gemmatimonadaceae bacterium]|nr:TolC family protein [Gemmatimonadaceae bacterium]